jgi:hypothetical protein
MAHKLHHDIPLAETAHMAICQSKALTDGMGEPLAPLPIGSTASLTTKPMKAA